MKRSVPRCVLMVVCVLFLLGCQSGSSPETLSETPREPEVRAKHIILIILDTLRADHLSCYGYPRSTSPTIDSLAAEGMLFSNAISQAPWTLPAHASIWTGLSVRSHGTNYIGEIGEGYDLRLDPALPSIPVLFQEAGFRTVGVTNFVLLSHEFGFDQGFDWYDCDRSGMRTAGHSTETLLSFLDRVQDEQPLFCVLHLYDIHAPYDAPAILDPTFVVPGFEGVTNWEFSEEGEILNADHCQHLINMYDCEILYVDRILSYFFEGLRERGLADSTLLIITSDHGEEFLEHGGFGHGHTLFQEQLHIPMIIAGPGIAAGSVSDAQVGLYDIMPTVLSYFSMDVPEGVEGVDILSDDAERVRPIPSGGVSPDRYFLLGMYISDFPTFSVTYGPEKVIAFMEQDRFDQYDLASDPGEETPLPADSIMLERALYHWATPPQGKPTPIGAPEEVNEELRDLGYIR